MPQQPRHLVPDIVEWAVWVNGGKHVGQEFLRRWPECRAIEWISRCRRD
jgi:hypothetical protein